MFLNGHYDITDNIAFNTDCCTPTATRSRRTPAIRTSRRVVRHAVSADSVYNPLGSQNAGGCRPASATSCRRGWEVPREVNNSLNTFRFTGALHRLRSRSASASGTGTRATCYNQQRRRADQHRQPQHRRLSVSPSARRSSTPRASPSAAPRPTRSRWASVRAPAPRGTRSCRPARPRRRPGQPRTCRPSCTCRARRCRKPPPRLLRQHHRHAVHPAGR